MENLEHQLLLQRETARSFFWHKVRWNFISSHLKLSQVRALLDVGAGSGIFADYVKRKLPKTEYFFVEPSTTLSQHLREQFGEGHDLLGAKDYRNVDVVMLLDVLEHIEDDYGFLKDLIKKMKPGATLGMTVPAMKFLWSGWDPLVGHHRRYERRELLELFKRFEGEFEVKECRFLFWELLPLALHRKWKLRSEVIGRFDPLKESEVPKLPAPVNWGLYMMSSLGLLISRWMPFGSTLALVGVKK